MKVIFVSMHSATIELENDRIFESESPFSVYLNDKEYRTDCTRNVFSVYDLEPDREYKITVNGESVCFRTDEEIVTLNVKDFYAQGDGVTDDTGPLQAAIMCCPEKGRVLIPEGRYLIRPVVLKSNIQIEIQKGAILLGETDRKKYPILPGRIPTNVENEEYYLGTWEGIAESAFAAVITGIGVENIKIYGQGVLDGQADKSDWWEKDIVKRIAWRPRGIFLNRCKNVAIQGITSQNTASWNQHPFFSQDISYVDMKLVNPRENPNTDGIDPESCEGVNIIGCEFSVGDDCIAIKSGKYEMGKKLKTPCEDVVIRNCCMKYGHGAVTLGSELSAGLKRISVTQCRFEKTDRGLRIKSQRGRGRRAIVEDVLFDGIEMINVKAPLVINMFYKARNNVPDAEYTYNHQKLPIDEGTPYLGKFHFKNIKAIDAEWTAGAFWGLPEQPIEEIILENVFCTMKENAEPGKAIMTLDGPWYCKSGFHFYWVNRVRIINTEVVGATTEPFILQNVNEVINS